MMTLTTEDEIIDKDEVLKMATQAGMRLDKHNGGFVDASELKRFAKLVAQHEREACAKLVDDNAKACINNSMAQMVLYANATAIRARGEPTLRGEAT